MRGDEEKSERREMREERGEEREEKKSERRRRKSFCQKTMIADYTITENHGNDQ